MFRKWRERRWQKEVERRENETLEETVARLGKADYVIECGGSNLLDPDTFKDYDAEEVRQMFLECYGIDIVNPDAGPDWMPATH